MKENGLCSKCCNFYQLPVVVKQVSQRLLKPETCEARLSFRLGIGCTIDRGCIIHCMSVRRGGRMVVIKDNRKTEREEKK